MVYYGAIIEFWMGSKCKKEKIVFDFMPIGWKLFSNFSKHLKISSFITLYLLTYFTGRTAYIPNGYNPFLCFWNVMVSEREIVCVSRTNDKRLNKLRCVYKRRTRKFISLAAHSDFPLKIQSSTYIYKYIYTYVSWWSRCTFEMISKQLPRFKVWCVIKH